ncbi:ATP-binding protein [Microcoleus sp. C2C3]|uniref:ATP-binding protein n=1 Tax=unclassified Microcoleus TaxID=2642155 RepID=UPI002FCF2816
MTDDTLLLRDRITNTIALGESHFREFKSALEGPDGNKKPRPVKKICGNIGEALVAFANADGGELLIGVEDDGTVSGVPHTPEEVRLMLEAHKTHVHQDSELPITYATKLEVEEQTILFFSVLKGTTEIFQLPDGRCVRRKDKSTVPETVQKIQFDRQEIRSREFDRSFVDGATVNDLDITFVKSLTSNYLRGLSVERYLQQIGIAEYSMSGLRLRMAALLLFAKDIQKWHPRSQVRILKVAGTQLKSGENYNVSSEKTITGNIFDLLLKSWEELRFFLAYKTEFGTGARFEQRYIYPEQACREALVNAIAHRDYSLQSGIDVFIFDNRIEIKSPGSLLSTISVKDLNELKGAHESRNAFISQVLREHKFMRELGEGMKRIFESMEENELEKPKLSSDLNSFVVTLNNKSVFTDQQERWLSVFKQFDLTTLQKKIVVCGINGSELSQQDIYAAMNTDDRNAYDREVTGLRNAGILKQLRTNLSANKEAKNKGIDKSVVPRFKVEIPKKMSTLESNLCVFVKNLPYSTNEDEVRRCFEECGKVQKVGLPEPKAGIVKEYRFGFVYFYDSEAVQKAIKDFDQTQFGGRIISVRKYIPKLE